MTATRTPSVREINEHLISGYCYLYREGQNTVRLIRARTRKGVLEGRVLGTGKWEVIPTEAHVELSKG